MAAEWTCPTSFVQRVAGHFFLYLNQLFFVLFSLVLYFLFSLYQTTTIYYYYERTDRIYNKCTSSWHITPFVFGAQGASSARPDGSFKCGPGSGRQ